MSIDPTTARQLTDALQKVLDYAKASSDIPSWEAEEIGSLLEDVQLIVNDNIENAERSDRDKAVIDLPREQAARNLAHEKRQMRKLHDWFSFHGIDTTPTNKRP